MAKQVKFKKEATDKIRIGIDIVCRAIRSTIGPKGRNVFIDNELQPKITNDGHTIANSITLDDKLENLGAWLVKNSSGQTNDDAGDGTSTTSVLLKAIIDEALKRPESPMEIKRQLLKTGKDVVSFIKDNSREVKEKDIKSVATISSESEFIGQLISDIIKEVGRNVPVSIEDSMDPEITYSVVEGLETKAGAMLVNESKAELLGATVFATDKKISSLADIAVLMQIFMEKSVTTPVFILPDIDETVFKLFMRGKAEGKFNAVIIRAKGFELFDMASVCGATIISSATGLDFKDVKAEHLGYADKIITNDKKTLIIAPQTEIRNNAIQVLREQIRGTSNIYEKQALNKRADALQGGIAIIKVGAHTDSEREYMKYKIEDAINATKSALEEGLVEGGGMCLYRISNRFKGKNIGEDILRVALKEPLKAIIDNCGEDYTSIIKKLPNKKGYDALNDKMVDMFKVGIVDPAKVTRTAFENALETASNFITAEVAITDTKENETIRK